MHQTITLKHNADSSWRLLISTAGLTFSIHLIAAGLASAAAYSFWQTTGDLCYRRTILAAALWLTWGWAIAVIVRTGCRMAREGRQTAASARLLARPLPARLRRVIAEVGLQGQVTLFACTAPAAFVAGLRRPHIFLTTTLLQQLDDAELTVLLRHEALHVQQRDPLRLVIAQSVAAVFPRFALLTPLHASFQLASELEADRAATRRPQDRWHLASALLKVMKARHTEAAQLVTATAGFDRLTTMRLAHLTGMNVPAAESPVRPGLNVRLIMAGIVALAVLWWCPVALRQLF